MTMRDERYRNQKTGALPTIKKMTIESLGVYAGKSERHVLGKDYLIYHHFFVNKSGEITKYEDIYEEIV